jgi:predicted CXXCH cytochrome family protein
MPADLAGCVRCHATTVDAAGTVVAGGTHANGRVEGQYDVDCLACHRGVAGGATVRSSHLGAEPALDLCRTCHGAVQQQADGHYRLPSDPSFPDATCLGCHDGEGQALGGRTPPVLLGWTDTAAGDFHGARAGAGSGGTLKAPYGRGQDPVPCGACHDEHASANAFLIAASVNGTAIPAAAIDRAGVGAEVLCAACHEGERHGSCSGCHAVDPEPPGSPCFWCHGHEGIVRWYPPEACDGCHTINQPATEYVPPVVTSLTVSGVTATSATIRWYTGELATSWVEYGVGTAGSAVGGIDIVYGHAVTLTGLSPSTTYVWRVRSSDPFRNVTTTELRTLATIAADAVPTPDLAPVDLAGAYAPSTTVVAGLRWYLVTAPSGTAIEYEVQLAADASFTVPASADLAAIDATLATGNSGWIAGTPAPDGSAAVRFDVTLTDLPQDDCVSTQPAIYWFRVRARDQTGKVSEWSAPASFAAMAWQMIC